MGLQDDEDPRVEVEFTILPPFEEKKKEPAALKSAPPPKKVVAPAPAAPAKVNCPPAKAEPNQPRYM